MASLKLYVIPISILTVFSVALLPALVMLRTSAATSTIAQQDPLPVGQPIQPFDLHFPAGSPYEPHFDHSQPIHARAFGHALLMGMIVNAPNISK